MDKTANLEMRWDILNGQLQLRQVEIRNRDPLQKAISAYNSILNLGGNFTGDLQVIYDEADKLGVELQSVIHTGDSISISCQADSAIAFDRYVAALEESDRFSKVIDPPEGFPYTEGGTITVEPKATG